MLMWGQPPSAVRASEARLGFAASIPNMELLVTAGNKKA
jgi:hypothetical protein